jgi:hypothetical protein
VASVVALGGSGQNGVSSVCPRTSSFLATEKNFSRIMGWKDLWRLEAILGRKTVAASVVRHEVA